MMCLFLTFFFSFINVLAFSSLSTIGGTNHSTNVVFGYHMMIPEETYWYLEKEIQTLHGLTMIPI